MNLEPVIGIEIHVELKTRTKMFSSAPCTFGALPNSQVNPIDIALPGTLPSVNKQAVIFGIQVANALHMSIDNELWFDRKNYFYSDLPKGYQITQKDRPIGKNGFVTIELDNGSKNINIERIHLEEDTAKQIHQDNYTLLDYNRAGIPLIEIVSKPNISNGVEAKKYVEKIKSIVTFLGVSDGKMEEGSLRCDVNVSLRPYGSDKLGTKVEIKNLNSTSNVEKAIEYEIQRQEKLLLRGERVEQETKRFDENLKETVTMRKKSNSIDYKYFPETNISPIKLSDEFIKKAIESSSLLAEDKERMYLSIGLSEIEARQMVQDKDVSDYFDSCLEINKSKAKMLWNWINGEILSYLNKNKIGIKDINLSPNNLLCLLDYLDKGLVSNSQAKIVLNEIIITNEKCEECVDRLGIKQNNDEDEILKIVKSIIEEYPQSVRDYKCGKDKAIKFMIGQMMKKTKGKVNPQIANKLLLEKLNEY